MNRKKGVILLSGGLDSATTAAIAIDNGFELSAMTFSYGQKHKIEIDHALKLVDFFKIRDHNIIELPCDIFNSSLVENNGQKKLVKSNNGDDKIPGTYVPARNILFLSYALAYAESIEARDIFIGANSVDYSGYPDCRPEFIKSFNDMANIGTKSGISGHGIFINAPLIDLTKSEIIKKGIELGVDYSLTHSCYFPLDDGSPCLECDSCKIRVKGFLSAHITDPRINK